MAGPVLFAIEPQWETFVFCVPGVSGFQVDRLSAPVFERQRLIENDLLRVIDKDLAKRERLCRAWRSNCGSASLLLLNLREI